MSSNKLSHTVWECKYHVVWIPKYRRKTVYGRLRKEIGYILRRLCEYKGNSFWARGYYVNTVGLDG